MRTKEGSTMRRPTRAALVLLTIVSTGMGVASDGLAAGTPQQKCAGAKLKAAGKKLAAKMSCHAKAKTLGAPVDASCLTKAETKFSAAIAKAGTACTGEAGKIESNLDDCVTALLAEIPGAGRCPGTSSKAAGKAGSGLCGCQAKGITKPGSFVVCDAKVDGKLGSALAKAGACVSTANVHSAVHDCLATIDAEIEPPPTTTSSSTSTTTTTLPRCCQSGGSSCTSDVDESTCTSGLSGTLGPVGSICDGATGQCTTGAQSAGNCCTYVGLCFGGPSANAASCVSIGGSFVADAVCTPSGGCKVPCQATTGGFCWFAGIDGADCDGTCANAGRVYDGATESFAGGAGTDANCAAVLTALGMAPFSGSGSGNLGCSEFSGLFSFRGTLTSSPSNFASGYRRACACQ